MKSILLVISLSLIGLVTAGNYFEGEDGGCCEDLYIRRDELEIEIGHLLSVIDDANDELDHLAHKVDKLLIDQHNSWSDLKHFMTKTRPKPGGRGHTGHKGPIGPKGPVGETGQPGQDAYIPLTTEIPSIIG